MTQVKQNHEGMEEERRMEERGKGNEEAFAYPLHHHGGFCSRWCDTILSPIYIYLYMNSTREFVLMGQYPMQYESRSTEASSRDPSWHLWFGKELRIGGTCR